MKGKVPTSDRLCTMTEAARILSVSVDTVRRLISCGAIKAVRIFDMPRIKFSEVQRYIQTLKKYQ